MRMSKQFYGIQKRISGVSLRGKKRVALKHLMKKKSSKSQKAEASEQKQDESPNPFTGRGVAPHEMAGLMNDE